jgi:hypothetical protein
MHALPRLGVDPMRADHCRVESLDRQRLKCQGLRSSGTLNLITPDVRNGAARLVRAGVSVSCSLPETTHTDACGRISPNCLSTHYRQAVLCPLAHGRHHSPEGCRGKE